MAGAKLVCVDLCDRGDEALQERFLRHFKAEDRDGHARAHRNVFAEVESEGCFSLRRARSKNEKLGILKAAEKLVEFRVAGGNAGDAFAFAENSFEAFEIVANDVLYGNEAGLDAIFGEGKD